MVSDAAGAVAWGLGGGGVRGIEAEDREWDGG